ncbi:MAG TPA: hypothetical protein VFB72_20155 [Verrucomicrobiae bacterium]|nr:hypothetical protein [Verrucomicrobiae bacterium]
MEDNVEFKEKNVCSNCYAIEARCFYCKMPVLDGYKKLSDGRYICARELKTVVESDDEAKEICQRVESDLDRLLSRFLTIPDGNIQLSLQDTYHMQELGSVRDSEFSCATVFGVTGSHPQPNHKFVHTVDLLSYMTRPHLMAVCAHEYTHCWMNQTISLDRERALDRNTLEAFCELVAFKYMDSLHEDAEMEYIKHNGYTQGKILVLIEADKKYGFGTVMDWLADGEDPTLALANIDRVRAVRSHYVAPLAPQTQGLVYGSAVKTPVPDTLELKGISGVGQHRFALINNATFETMEKGKVRVGQKALNVTCLEIGTDYVTIQVEGSAQKKRLTLHSPK